MSYIESGKSEGATVHFGGERHGTEGYFIQPTIFTNTTPGMKIVKEEIFGPVGAVIRFKDAKGKLLSSLLDRGLESDVVLPPDRSYKAGERLVLWSCCCGLQPGHQSSN
jgi:hypothetical protein